MTVTHSTRDLAQLDGGVLGLLSFQWTGDRYRHRWSFGEDQPHVLDSIESDHSVPWPVSPPLQQVYRQDFSDGRNVMFGVGMAGRGHWSGSFTLVPDLRSWIVELACCSPSQPEQLGSAYHLNEKSQLQFDPTDESICACSFDDHGIRIEPLSKFTRFELHDTRLFISPSENDGGSSTIQWGYRIRVLGS